MSQNRAYAVEMRQITKTFGAVVANAEVNLQIPAGSIHAIIGENGAGKSTIMNILYGFYLPDQGEIRIQGEVRRLRSTRDALAVGLGMVHQHFMLAGAMTVLDNVILGSEPTKGLLIDYAAAREKVLAISQQYGLQIRPEAHIEELTVGEQQRVEIVKILYRGAQILILDEPTAVLTPQETTEFFQILRTLRDQGKTIIIITHKLAEVLAISDNVTVMRAGRVVGEVATRETDAASLARLMVGREVLLRIDKPPRTVTADHTPRLSVNNLTWKNARGRSVLHDISLNIYPGEVLGIAGVEGNGQTELVEVLARLHTVTSGEILLDGQNITHCNARQAKAHKIGHIPEDRHKRGLLMQSPLWENAILGQQHNAQITGGWLLRNRRIRQHTTQLIQDFDVRPPQPDLAARALSGGNQQKFIIAREFALAPRFLIAAQPTRGVDIGAIEFIYQKILQLRAQGVAILLVSAELEEIFSLSDRIAVMYEGRIVATVDPATVSQQELGLLMTGGK
jgi:general nucleoside transport system ATP-binding protein